VERPGDAARGRERRGLERLGGGEGQGGRGRVPSLGHGVEGDDHRGLPLVDERVGLAFIAVVVKGRELGQVLPSVALIVSADRGARHGERGRRLPPLTPAVVLLLRQVLQRSGRLQRLAQQQLDRVDVRALGDLVVVVDAGVGLLVDLPQAGEGVGRLARAEERPLGLEPQRRGLL
jgi:hypothetical protein